jgi:hypothetical protein
MIPDLETLQRILRRLIETPAEGPSELESIESLIVGDRRLSARRRLEIYAGAYFQRLLDVMREDFPATRTVVGDERFSALVRTYLAAHPPTEPSVFDLGRHFPRFLAKRRDLEKFVAELARLERATLEVFHAAEATALSAEAMRAIAPERWPALELRTHPALAIVDCKFAVAPVLRAISEHAPWSNPPREAASVLVWRQSSQVFYRPLEPGEREALKLAARGASFASMCAAASAKVAGDAVAAINRMLARWLSEGVLVAVDG